MWQSAVQELPSNLLEAIFYCDEDAFPNIHRPLPIGCTLPIRSSEAERSFSLMKLSKERFSDLAVIPVVHYSERLEVEEKYTGLCNSSSKKTFSSYFVQLTRHIEKLRITIIVTAVPFNHALLFLVFWLKNKVTPRFYITQSQTLFESQKCWKWRFRG